MFRMITLAALAVPASALACPGAETASLASTQTVTAADPTHCAKNASLVGTNCSWSTGSMAQRVQAEGAETSLTTRLTAQTTALPSKVAAPYRAGDLYVIANTVIEAANPSDTLALTGKMLEVDGVKYLLVTSFSRSST